MLARGKDQGLDLGFTKLLNLKWGVNRHAGGDEPAS